MKKKFIFITVILVLFSNFIFAEKDFSLWGSGDVFTLSPLKDSILLGCGLTFAATDIILDKVINLNQLDFSDDMNFLTEEVNPFDRSFINDYSKTLDYLGTGFEGLSVLSPLCLLATSKSEWLTIGTMYTEALLYSYSIKELAKLLVNRTRPFMYSEDYPLNKVEENDWADSFFSGHATLSFAAATFSSYTFCNYFPTSNWKIPVIALSYSLACTTSVLRILSGNHFVTDVLIGAAIGSATGFLIPFLHTLNTTKKINSNFSASILPTGIICQIKL